MNTQEPYVTIAIVFKEFDTFVKESVKKCLEINYSNFEIILIPDFTITNIIDDDRIKIIPSSAVAIPVKRNIAIKNASTKSEFIAYIDSDAFPDKNWLKNAICYFKDKSIAVVGGPNLTPPNEPVSRKVSGYIIETKIGFGNTAFTQMRNNNQNIKFMPTCNMIVRKCLLFENFFDETLGTGEDAKFSFDMIKKGYKLYFAKNVIVYHHRKKILFPIMKAFYNYGYFKYNLVIRGQVFSKFYFLPSIFLICLLMGAILSFFSQSIFYLLAFILLTYGLIYSIAYTLHTGNLLLGILTSLVVFNCHISYGLGFLKSFFIYIFFKKKKTQLDRKQLKKVSPNNC